MSLVFVQQGFVNKSSITAAICFCVDREQQPTRWERRTGCTANPMRPSFFLSVTFFSFFFFAVSFLSEWKQPNAGVVNAICFSHQLQGVSSYAEPNKPSRPISSILTTLLCRSSQQNIGCAALTLSSLLCLITLIGNTSHFSSCTHKKLTKHKNTINKRHNVLSYSEARLCIMFLSKEKGQEIISDNKSTFSVRGQTAFFMFHKHSWLLFNVDLAIFTDSELLISKRRKVLFLQVVGMVTAAHWCIVCFMATS